MFLRKWTVARLYKDEKLVDVIAVDVNDDTKYNIQDYEEMKLGILSSIDINTFDDVDDYGEDSYYQRKLKKYLAKIRNEEGGEEEESTTDNDENDLERDDDTEGEGSPSEEFKTNVGTLIHETCDDDMESEDSDDIMIPYNVLLRVCNKEGSAKGHYVSGKKLLKILLEFAECKDDVMIPYNLVLRASDKEESADNNDHYVSGNKLLEMIKTFAGI